MRQFHVGQCWTYKARAGEESSRIIVTGQDDIANFGSVFHVAVINLKIKDHSSASGLAEYIEHLPFADTALDESVEQLAFEVSVSAEFAESAIAEWGSRFRDGEGGGVWTAPVSAVIQVIEDGFEFR